MDISLVLASNSIGLIENLRFVVDYFLRTSRKKKRVDLNMCCDKNINAVTD